MPESNAEHTAQLLDRLDSILQAMGDQKLLTSMLDMRLDTLGKRATALLSVACEMEEHLHVTSIAVLHVALGNSSMEETVLAADAMRFAYRIEQKEDSHHG